MIAASSLQIENHTSSESFLSVHCAVETIYFFYMIGSQACKVRLGLHLNVLGLFCIWHEEDCSKHRILLQIVFWLGTIIFLSEASMRALNSSCSTREIKVSVRITDENRSISNAVCLSIKDELKVSESSSPLDTGYFIKET